MTSERRGLWITLEGGDGSGKTTQAALLAEWLGAQGRTVLQLVNAKEFVTIPVTTLADGVYFLRAMLPEGTVVQKIVIRH